ncbi:AGE family epimerase/isomerase [Glycocaulis abyssi]|uniref:AGE family epimerase/isomerase n=1 Tax=Glycocaulis abyssi TaxID=1433403 RepID=A0ABV9NCW8_9PROT
MSAHAITPFILCGGAGTRLWPLSDALRPKPFLSLPSGRTMLAETALRLEGETRSDLRFSSLTAIGSARHGALLRAHLPAADLVLEPVARDSAPAVALAALLAEPDALVLILPADHHIARPERFLDAIASGAEAAADGRIVVFGITPDHPATGYGYIRAREAGAVRKVEAFVEKPDLATARDYLASGEYFWNAGIFLFRADVMLGELEREAPSVLSAAREALAGATTDTAIDARIVARAAFAAAPAISIDYAVMEKTALASLVPADMGWSDVGDYAALSALSDADKDGNAVHGPAVMQDVTGSYIRSEGPVIAVKGVEGLAIAATRDAVIVTRLDEAAGIKPLVSAAQTITDLSGEAAGWARNWLFDACLPLWARSAWDAGKGGFVESLTLEGAPQPERERRMRVIPRQIFAFSQAALLGWDKGEARRIAMLGLEYLDGPARASQGGWVHRLDRDGTPLDPRRGLYDHAFVILAGASAFQAFGETRALELALEALDFMTSRMSDSSGEGFYDPEMAPDVRAANPHMHLLEACLALEAASGSADALDCARLCVDRFEDSFFHPASGAVIEYLHADWSRGSGPWRTEAGHCHEWAWLLAEYEARTGHDLISWRRRLIGFADTKGRDRESGFVHNSVDTTGGIIDANRRLWPQLEMLRARLRHPETAAPGEAERLLESLRATYLADACQGGWMDAYDRDGAPLAKDIPASMLYHIMTAIGPLAAR